MPLTLGRARTATPSQHADMIAMLQGTAQAVLSDPATMAVYLDPTFKARAHLAYISQALTRVAQGHTKRLLLMLPPQSGKSTLAAVWLPFWWMARNPAQRIIIGSYGQSLALKRGRDIRRLVDHHGWKWDMDLEWGAKVVTDWSLTSGGGIKSVGVGSGVTGSPADLLVLDDPHKSRAEADSRTMRDRVWDWYSSDFLTRLAPGGPVVAMLTPWHEDDWAHRVLERDGRVEEGGEWEVVRLPALADSEDDPLGRLPGEPLPHPMLDESDVEAALAHWHERRRQVTARDWGALYQLDPKPAEGALVDRSVLRRQRHTPPPSTPVKAAVAVDPSGGGRDTAGIIGGYLAEDGRLYLTEDATMVGTSEAWARATCELAAAINAEVIVVEKNYGGDMARNVIRSAWDALARERSQDGRFTGLAPQVKLVTAKRGKLLRAEPVAQQLVEDRVRLGAALPELEEEWASWQPTDPDSPGRIDASCYLVYAVLPVPGAEAVVSSPTGVPRSLAGRGSGVRIQRRRV